MLNMFNIEIFHQGSIIQKKSLKGLHNLKKAAGSEIIERRYVKEGGMEVEMGERRWALLCVPKTRILAIIQIPVYVPSSWLR